MPKRARDYESDNGFVEDAPRSKKGGSGGNELKRTEGKKPVSTEMGKDDDGNEYWEISGKRRVQVSSFKGATMVSIREFYEKDGKTLPGKKGISLSVDQFTAVLDILPQIEGVLESKGITIPRPKYDGKPTVEEPAADEEDGEEGEEDEAEEAKDEKPKTSGRLDKFKMKRNHEATSDEDDG
ncbi:hypothetical protein LTR36_008628 [Oleoguttula mirabilis]|uniref:Transcriptional coactivator p15 (PC4) C-terminal domain-containing protein n=1 Tax=Oleoguttula mirabilis TaxID=1507867 RepID=A0AAV9JTI5_9PEZI|nr:hypothetical protein LTR36_008628 [Oleoguttula mirabilis]